MTLISTELEVKNTVKTFYRDVKYYKTTLRIHIEMNIIA